MASHKLFRFIRKLGQMDLEDTKASNQDVVEFVSLCLFISCQW